MLISADCDCSRRAAGGCFRANREISLNSATRLCAHSARLPLLPVYSALSGNIFILTLFTRIVIFALAAASLNLIMGYGGMMSFGHAAYLGIGGYAVGILAFEGIGSGFIQWPVALAASALYALVIGALSLRTRGVYFIMITLAFAQMAYYIASGMSRYGGDDGLTIYKRSTFWRPDRPVEPRAVLLPLPRLPVRRHLSDLAHHQFAVRHGGAGHSFQRAAHAGDRLSRQPLSAGLLRHLRHDLRPRRRASRQQYRLHQPGRNVLDPFATHGDGFLGHARCSVPCWAPMCFSAGRSPVAVHDYWAG